MRLRAALKMFPNEILTLSHATANKARGGTNIPQNLLLSFHWFT
jgi:hypothetical protein